MVKTKLNTTVILNHLGYKYSKERVVQGNKFLTEHLYCPVSGMSTQNLVCVNSASFTARLSVQNVYENKFIKHLPVGSIEDRSSYLLQFS